jgi:hypothetical protein
MACWKIVNLALLSFSCENGDFSILMKNISYNFHLCVWIEYKFYTKSHASMLQSFLTILSFFWIKIWISFLKFCHFNWIHMKTFFHIVTLVVIEFPTCLLIIHLAIM